MNETPAATKNTKAIDPASSEALALAKGYFRRRLASDRGDVPGWVLITLMTAGLVVMMWGLAGPALQTVFDAAMNKVVAY
ncbi:MAG: hypothetical protein RL196_422 [Actinomycetota bacterium]|jgi:hypothetical protein